MHPFGGGRKPFGRRERWVVGKKGTGVMFEWKWSAQETKRGGSKRRETGQGAQSILKRYPSTNGGGASVRQVSFGGVPARKRNTESPKEVTRKRFQIET